MGPLAQIILGTAMLGACAIIHVGAVGASIPLFHRLARHVAPTRPILRVVAFQLLAVGVVLAAHTLQVWLWAGLFMFISDLPDLATSFYFATVTYTTLGYGDIVVGETARITATFCAITGLLTFGISTAVLIGVLSRTLPNVFDSRGP